MTPWRFVLWLWRCPTCVSLNELVLLVVIKMSSAQAAERNGLPCAASYNCAIGNGYLGSQSCCCSSDHRRERKSSRRWCRPAMWISRTKSTGRLNRLSPNVCDGRPARILERVDGPHKLTTIFGRNGTEITVTLLDREARTYRAVTRTGNYSKAAPRWPIQPERGAVLKREGESMVAAQHCTEWSWAVDTEIHILCGTPDGVLLRLVINGNTTVEATSVSYRQQLSKVFEVPPGYAPALEQAP